MERWPHRRRRGGAVNRARGRSLAGARRVHGSGGLVGRTHEPHAELHCRRLMWAPAGREQRSVRPPELTRRLLLGPRWCWQGSSFRGIPAGIPRFWGLPVRLGSQTGRYTTGQPNLLIASDRYTGRFDRYTGPVFSVQKTDRFTVWCPCWCLGAPTLASSSPKKTCSHESGHHINKTKMFHALKLEKYADTRHLQFRYICIRIDKIELSHFTNLQ
jgi:hypothetical protein